MRILKNLSLIICLSLSCLTVFGQSGSVSNNIKDESTDAFNRMNNMVTSSSAMFSRKFIDRPSLSEEERERIKKILLPDAKISDQYKSFLKQKHTGLFRLFPDLNCEESKNVIRVDGNCAGIVLGSWRYSFRQKDYSPGNFFDIQLKDGNFITNGLLAQGILGKLGDIPLDNLAPDSQGLKFLTDYNPATDLEGAKTQFLEISKKIEVNGFTYTNVVPAAAETTYALRVIAYRDYINPRGDSYKMTPEDGNFFYLNSDKRIDVMLVFRIVKKDDDGSVTVLWKEIKRKDSPELVFRKKDKLSDLK